MNSEQIRQGFCDFTAHVMTPRVISLLKNPAAKTALEIGHGEGRLMLPACHHFAFVAGADVHDRNVQVGEFLREQGVENFRLNKTKGHDLGMMPESVDFVFSYDSLRFVESHEMFSDLLLDTFNVLRAPGVALLHVGRMDGLRRGPAGHVCYVDMPEGEPTLLVHLKHLAWTAKRLGFEVVDKGVTGPLNERGKPPKQGDQSFILLFKRTAGCLLSE